MNSSQIPKALAITLFSLTGILCGCQTTVIQVSDVEFFVTKKWKIKKVMVNGDEVVDTDLSKYRLDLREDFSFTRTTIKGDEEEGIWKLTSGLSQIILFVGDPREERYLLINLNVRDMEVKVLQDSFKQGELDIRYFLEPTKAQ